MPVQLSYPGVYVEEVPSGVRSITGVATSICAFVGRTRRGPTDRPVVVTSFGDFERVFGGLWEGSRLGHSVRDFFLGGGSTAVIARLYRSDGGNDRSALTIGTVELGAAAPGAWGNELQVRVDHDTADPSLGTQFNLYVRDGGTGAIEEHRNLTTGDDDPRNVNDVLAAASDLVRVTNNPGARPAASGDSDDPWGDPTAHEAVDPGGEADDGQALDSDSFIGAGTASNHTGLYLLDHADLFNLLVIPPYLATDTVDTGVVTAAATYCEQRRAMLLVDPLPSWDDIGDVTGADLAATLGTTSRNAALYFPRLVQPDPVRDGLPTEFAPSGAVAGVMARTDAQRGVWKAPAGLEANLVGVPDISVDLTDGEIGQANPLGVNCLRTVPSVGRVVWGARTMQGADRLASEWKYVPVRRTALFVEESLYRGTQWVVFEPNDEPLWAQIRLSVGTFMHDLFRQGAFQGSTPRDAYLVKCDRETTTQSDIDRGIVNIYVGFAPLKPAEFVIIRLQQLAGQSAA